MKHLLTTLLLATLWATGYGQTLKSVMIDTNGVQVNQFGSGSATNPAIKLGATNWGFWRATGPDRIFVSVNGTTVATFTSNSVAATTFSGNLSGGVTIGAGQSISFGGGANVSGTRTNLSLGATWLTNTNADTFRSAIGIPLSALTNTNATNFRTAIGAQETLISATNIKTINGQPILGAGDLVISGGTNTNSFNQSLNTTDDVTFNALNVSNKALTRTNLGLGATNDVEFNSISAGYINFETNSVFEIETATFLVPLNFLTNAAAATRTNLGLGATWLTNGNITNFRSAVLPTYSGNAGKVLAVNSTTSDIEWITPTGGTNTNPFNQSLNTGDNVSFNSFDVTDKSTSRGNLGLGATWLTNDNVTNFRAAIGLGTNSAVTFSNMTLQNLINSGSPNERGFLVRNASGQINLKGEGVNTGHPALYGWNGTVNTNFNGNASAPTNTNTPAAWIAVEEGTNAYRIPLYR